MTLKIGLGISILFSLACESSLDNKHFVDATATVADKKFHINRCVRYTKANKMPKKPFKCWFDTPLCEPAVIKAHNKHVRRYLEGYGSCCAYDRIGNFILNDKGQKHCMRTLRKKLLIPF